MKGLLWKSQSVKCLKLIFFLNHQISDTDLSILPLHSFLWCNHQLFHPRAHVRLLRPGSLGASGAEIPLVEEIPHHYSDGGYYIFRYFLWMLQINIFDR